MKAQKRTDISKNKLNSDTPFDICEAYKTIRTNLLFSLAPMQKKIIVVSSSLPNEGKSTTCGNLAITLAQTTAKVLLIDGDLRKPTQHKFFGVENTKGLSNILVGFDTVSDSIKKNVVKNLDLITAGAYPPNPSELLGSTNMQLFLQKMEEYYDYIIIDSPPINIVTDAVLLSQYAAGVLMIARAKTTSIDTFENAVEAVEKGNGTILGVVLSDVSKRSTTNKRRRSSYYAYYKAYSDRSKPRERGNRSVNASAGTIGEKSK